MTRPNLYSLRTRLLIAFWVLVVLLTAVYTGLALRTLAHLGLVAQETNRQALVAQARDSLLGTNKAVAARNTTTLARAVAAGRVAASEAAALYADPSVLVPGQGWLSRQDTYRGADGRLVGGTGFQIYVPARIPQTPALFDELNLVAHLNPILGAILRDNREVVAAYLVSSDRDILLYHSAAGTDLNAVLPAGYEPQNAPYYQAGDGVHDPTWGSVWTQPYGAPAGQGPSVSSVTPIYLHNHLTGIIGLDVTLARLGQSLADPQIAGLGGASLLLDEQDRVLAASTPTILTALGLPAPASGTEWAGALLPAGGAAGSLQAALASNGGDCVIGGRQFYLAQERQPDTGWRVVSLVPEDRLLAGMTSTRNAVSAVQQDTLVQNLVFGGLAGLAMALIVLQLAYRWLKPLQQVRTAVHALGSGDLRQRLPVRGRDELADLSREFNGMADRLEARSAQAEALYEVAVQISLLHDLDRTLQLVVDRVRAVLGGDLTMILLQDPETGELSPRAGSGVIHKDVAGVRVALGQGLIGRVVATGLPLAAGPANEAERPAVEEARSLFEVEGLQALLGVPLCIGPQCIGALVLGNRTPRAFHRHELELLSAFANQAAVAVENARLADVERQAHARQQTLYLETISALADAMQARDAYTHRHSDVMVNRAAEVARIMGCTEEEIAVIRLAAILHDVGKIGIPDAILRKAGPLTAEEYATMQQHPEIGARIVSRVESLRAVVPLVLHHQERWDGRGYPGGLCGEAIPQGARILAVVDAFGAMTEDRVYRPGLGEERALEELHRGAGSEFDPAAVEAFTRWWRQRRDGLNGH